jgi:DNA-directed RNA polymerase subunit RPC12/RpoP
LLEPQSTNQTPPIPSTSGVNPNCESGGKSSNVNGQKTEYICDICGQKIKNKHHLKGHVLIHTAPEVRCDICDKP